MSIDPYNWNRVFKSAVRHVESNRKIGEKNRVGQMNEILTSDVENDDP